MSIIYEVSIELHPNIVDAFHAWLPKHVQEVLTLGKFNSAQILSLKTEPSHNHRALKLKVCYEANTPELLSAYLDTHAPKMRQEAIERFGSYLTTSRTVYEIEQTIKGIL